MIGAAVSEFKQKRADYCLEKDFMRLAPGDGERYMAPAVQEAAVFSCAHATPEETVAVAEEVCAFSRRTPRGSSTRWRRLGSRPKCIGRR